MGAGWILNIYLELICSIKRYRQSLFSFPRIVIGGQVSKTAKASFASCTSQN